MNEVCDHAIKSCNLQSKADKLWLINLYFVKTITGLVMKTYNEDIVDLE